MLRSCVKALVLLFTFTIILSAFWTPLSIGSTKPVDQPPSTQPVALLSDKITMVAIVVGLVVGGLGFVLMVIPLSTCVLIIPIMAGLGDGVRRSTDWGSGDSWQQVCIRVGLYLMLIGLAVFGIALLMRYLLSLMGVASPL